MRRTLEQTLHRGLRSAALWTALCVGGLGALGSLAVLQAQAKRHLDLLARTVAYSVEAAVTFRDAEAAREAMQAVLTREQLAAIRIELGDGRLFAEVERAGGWSSSLEAGLARWLPLQAQAPVLPEDPARGRVHVQTSAAPLLWLLAAYLGVALATVAGTAGLVLALARRVERQITTPLDSMRRLTRSIRADRAFDRRAPGADIEEFHALAEDFNALLGMVQAHEAALLRQQELLAQHNQLLRREAFSDTLTGLANRARFRQEVASALERAAGAHERPQADALRRPPPEGVSKLGSGPSFAYELAVLFIDADGLKRVNDLHGHAVGDRLLQEVAARLRGALRDSDCVARLGGDEYAVLLEPLLQREHLPLLVGKIQAAMQSPLAVDAQLSLQPSVSVGWAIYPGDGADVDALLARADEAMYANKRARRAPPRELPHEANA